MEKRDFVLLDITKKLFPECTVKVTFYNDFADLLTIRYESGNRYTDEGLPNPKWFWHEFCALISKNRTEISESSLPECLASTRSALTNMIAASKEENGYG